MSPISFLPAWLTPDMVNGLFEGISALFTLNHCRVIWKSKQAYGMSMLSTAFFTCWGCWNIYFYPYLNQWYSFLGGIFILLANLVLIGLVFYLRKQQKASP